MGRRCQRDLTSNMRVATVLLSIQSSMNKFKVWRVKLRLHWSLTYRDGMSLKWDESWFMTLLKPVDDGHLPDDCLTKTSTCNEWRRRRRVCWTEEHRSVVISTNPPLPCHVCVVSWNKSSILRTLDVDDGEICMQSNSARRGLNGRMKGGGRNERVRTRVGTTPTPWLRKEVIF